MRLSVAEKYTPRLGLDQLGISYEVNLPFSKLRPDDRVAVLYAGSIVEIAAQLYDPVLLQSSNNLCCTKQLNS